MSLKSWVVCTICAVCAAFSGFRALAQGPGGRGGGFSPEGFFSRLDRNGNGQLDPDELQNSPMRRMFEAGGRDLSKPITQQEFTEMAQQMQRGGRGGRGGPGGPPPGAPPQAPVESGPARDGAGTPAPPAGGSGGEDSRRRGGRGRRDREPEDRSAAINPVPGPTPGSPPSPRKDAGKKDGAAKVPVPRPRLQLELPEQYASRDTNDDRQLGLYEWPKTDLATFRRLDLNGDGFVTPHELAREARKRGDDQAPAVASAGSAPAAGPGTQARIAGATPGTDVAGASATAPPAGPPGGGRPPRGEGRADGGGRGRRGEGNGEAPAEAKKPGEIAFTALDRDKDNQLTEEEWQRSVSLKAQFERAGATLTLPASKESFLQAYEKIAR